ncbi:MULTISPECIES: ABC transporter ATP-binding protein [Methylobacteriaceae]|uniref:High-affinity branched-chain amino acid transporter, ATP-binding component of ABC transporter (LivG-like) n=1 Tax=Methylorubrum extorquens (strain DSM 6343 / CIP 106787 / DM4) TaxID=661410 RepID=C7CN22_METED|nr:MULTISPECIES: ABC transporter ATP-binding protein [Methylobacteriaceae]AYO84732.1 ABC transporter ATP-binding protein [Methylobacterium brachiatum]CAX17052.1 putative high-affinity branched-chain amino acid transporter, ATP-binding component of ABC transporter (livG-like) [Methylorubrum extorquens DM4]
MTEALNAPIIAARSLVKRFGAVTAARDVSIDIHPGTISGLIGTNGAGKTTFINMITGYLQPDAGSILLEGREIIGLTPRRITRLGVARSFQIPQLFDSLSAQENLTLALAAQRSRGMAGLLPLRERTLETEAAAILERFALAQFRDAPAGTLPEGIRKLLDIAVAMVGAPKVLFLDEPTSGVSSEEKFVIMDRVIAVTRAAGITVLFVEHDMEIVRRYSDRVIAFFEGRVLIDDGPERVLQDPEVRTYIIGEDAGACAA